MSLFFISLAVRASRLRTWGKEEILTYCSPLRLHLLSSMQALSSSASPPSAEIPSLAACSPITTTTSTRLSLLLYVFSPSHSVYSHHVACLIGADPLLLFTEMKLTLPKTKQGVMLVTGSITTAASYRPNSRALGGFRATLES